MSGSFTLKILAADKIFYEGEAVSLTIPAMDGYLQILAHHEKMVIALKEGLLHFSVTEGEEPRYGICGLGFARVSDNAVTVLVDSIEDPREVDEARAREAMARAQEQLRQDQSIQEYNISKASLARAMARLSHAGHGGASID